MSMAPGDPHNYYPPHWPSWPTYQVGPLPEPALTLRDKMAAACLPAIYASQTMLTDRAAVLAYEQADEMLKARESHDAAHDEGKK